MFGEKQWPISILPLSGVSQAEVRKPGLQHHMGLNVRNTDFVACDQRRDKPACASAQTDQYLYNLLFVK